MTDVTRAVQLRHLALLLTGPRSCHPPKKQETVLIFPPNYIVRKAVARMREHGYSQVPVVTGEDQTFVPKITYGMGLLC
jgi:hypothetical protein